MLAWLVGGAWEEEGGKIRGRAPGPGAGSCALRCLLPRSPGAEVIYNELMSDFEMDEKDFAADSWSLAVDSSFLQQHKKEVMKQQDVIYGTQGRSAAPPLRHPPARTPSSCPWPPCPWLAPGCPCAPTASC